MLNLKQLETFLWIARLGSFAAAADRLNSTQSAVSIRIQELEHSFGVKLFDRSHRAVQLTPKGEELAPMADQLIEMAWDIQAVIGDAESISAKIRIGVADLVALTWLGSLISAVRDEYPGVKLEIDVGLAVELIEKLRRRELDLVLTPADQMPSEFESWFLGNVDFLWMASPSMTMPSSRITPRMLQDFPVITLSEQSFHHNTVNKWFRENGAKCDRIISCNNISVLISLTIDGMGVGLVPAPCVEAQVKTKKLQVIDTDPKIDPVPFYALMPLDATTPLAEKISRIAVEVSDFKKGSPFAISVSKSHSS